jgi:chondroitin AC lyase
MKDYYLVPESRHILVQMQRKYRNILLISIILIGTCLSAREDSPDKTEITMEVFNLIISRIQRENEKKLPSNLDARVKSALNTYTSSGAFSDVDYGKTSQTNWEPLTHISRLSDFVFAYTKPDSSYYENFELYDKIVVGLQYWYDRNPVSDNWWYNQISEPQKLGVILIQMQKGAKQIPVDLEANTLERMRKDGGNADSQVGANKIDIALHWLYRTVLIRDEFLLKTAVSQAYEALQMVNGVGVKGEGLQYDYSFFQHGNQLYIGGYGDVLINGITLFALYTAGTPFALSGEKLALLSAFVRESYLKVIRGQYMLFSVSGRGGLSRQGELFKANAAEYIQRMQSIDPEYAVVYADAVKRLRGETSASYGIMGNNTYYFIGNYTVHTRPGYMFDVRLTSTRTARFESGNRENLKAYYAADGCTNIVVRGNEYASIFAVWNWTRVPGITCPQVSSIPLPPHDWAVYGTSAFAGGVSDSLYGVTVYAYDAGYTGVSAKKGWFFFDEEVVCLGSDINTDASVADYDINTTVNQCLLNGDVQSSAQGVVSVLSKGDHEYSRTPDWVLHDGIGYVFPQGGNIAVSNKSQTGNWYNINETLPNKMESKEVFTLWVNHGKNVQAGTYAYVIVPGKNNTEEMEQYMKDNTIEILANTESVQSVWHKGLDIWGIIFYEAGSIEHNGIRVQVDKPCTMLLRNTRSPKVGIYISDPARKEAKITIQSNFSALSGDEKEMVCDFRGTGIYAGATKLYEIDTDS